MFWHLYKIGCDNVSEHGQISLMLQYQSVRKFILVVLLGLIVSFGNFTSNIDALETENTIQISCEEQSDSFDLDMFAAGNSAVFQFPPLHTLLTKPLLSQKVLPRKLVSLRQPTGPPHA